METIQLIIDTFLTIIKICVPIGIAFLLSEKVINFVVSLIFNRRVGL